MGLFQKFRAVRHIKGVLTACAPVTSRPFGLGQPVGCTDKLYSDLGHLTDATHVCTAACCTAWQRGLVVAKRCVLSRATSAFLAEARQAVLVYRQPNWSLCSEISLRPAVGHSSQLLRSGLSHDCPGRLSTGPWTPKLGLQFGRAVHGVWGDASFLCPFSFSASSSSLSVSSLIPQPATRVAHTKCLPAIL